MSFVSLKKELEKKSIRLSAPCRIDCGGTMDIKTFYVSLQKYMPSTFNLALNIRTHVTLLPWKDNFVKVSSEGFDSEEYELDKAPFNSPMGLVFAACYHFGLHGVHVSVVSDSPPRSALGGSSTMLVAVIGALNAARKSLAGECLSLENSVRLAYEIEDGISPYNCGAQDHLAAAFGGVSQWSWPVFGESFSRKILLTKEYKEEIDSSILLAFCGVTHDSSTINQKWIKGFSSGCDRKTWIEILKEVNAFSLAVSKRNWTKAACHMGRETALRKKLTPEVFTNTGNALLKAADKQSCGARFTGAGGGGCLWAIGDAENISSLRPVWIDILKEEDGAGILSSDTDFYGLLDESIV